MKGIASGAVIVAVTVTLLAGAAAAAPAEEKQIQEKVWTIAEQVPMADGQKGGLP